MELDTDEGFSPILLAKTNFVGVLRRELSAEGWKRASVALGAATDPYQPIEARCRLSRGVLAAMLDFRTPVSIVTKGTLVWRDADILQDLSRRRRVTVCISIPTVDPAAWRATEPGTASPAQRPRIVERLSALGVRVGAAMAPLLPGITADEAHGAATVRAAADHGARFLWSGLLHLDQGIRRHYLSFLRDEYPDLLAGYAARYRGKYASPIYAERIAQRAERRQTLHDLGERDHTSAEQAERQLTLL